MLGYPGPPPLHPLWARLGLPSWDRGLENGPHPLYEPDWMVRLSLCVLARMRGYQNVDGSLVTGRGKREGEHQHQ